MSLQWKQKYKYKNEQTNTKYCKELIQLNQKKTVGELQQYKLNNIG